LHSISVKEAEFSRTHFHCRNATRQYARIVHEHFKSIGLAAERLTPLKVGLYLAGGAFVIASFAVATYGGQRQNPVLIGRVHWPAVLRLRGDVGARSLMDAIEVTDVECDGTGRPDDVDTAEELKG
jgi:hypothetical protein